MKKTAFIIAMLLQGLVGYSQNPASTYVKFMGYKSKVISDSAGNQNRTCIFPDGTECDEWQFYRGICGKQFSYCATKGLLTESVNDSINHTIYAVCVFIDSTGKKVKFPLLEFMEQNGDTLFKQGYLKKKRG